MALIDTNIIEEFDNLTRFGLAQFLLDYADFMNNRRIDVINYYAGFVRLPNENSFRELSRLRDVVRSFNDVVENNKDRFTHTRYWELVETMSDIETALDTIDNSSKWLRSAISRNDFSPSVEVEHVLRMFQTLEDVSRTVQGSDDPQNNWVNLALRNNLTEESYTTEGGNRISLSLQNRATIPIRSVVDTINGESVYGKDIDRQITFENDDLKVLSPRDTVFQSVNILSALKQGDNPQFRNQGVQANLAVGGNRGSIPFDIIQRQVISTFQSDDSLRAIRVTDIRRDQDGLFFTLEVETRLDEVITTTTQV